ncbi:unnamed protein product [Rotaria sordida]|uniref:Uncharacterized protein n=1 Tax=Rotaria sordida TaxID=392033 RepID=A0A815FDJ9_9BILA|nr:unnamed protein product [Rotaria sordida]
MATGDNDCYPTTSKFFKTEPSEFNSKQGESGEEISANYINILAAPKSFETNIKLRKSHRETLAQTSIEDVAFHGIILYSFEDFETKKLNFSSFLSSRFSLKHYSGDIHRIISVHPISSSMIRLDDATIEAFYENYVEYLLKNPPNSRDDIILFARRADELLHER